jgi:hypothetical protein
MAEDYSFAIQWIKTAPVDGGVDEAVPEKVREDRLKNEMTYCGISIKISSDTPSRHHLPFDRPFDRLTVLSKVEGLMALRKTEGRRCLRSLLSFDLEALDRLTAYWSIRLSRRSSAPCI